MEQPVRIKIIRNETEQTEQADEIDEIDEIQKTGRTIWEKVGKICLELLVFLTPLFFLPLSIAPLEINKQFLAGILVLVAFIFYLIHSFETKKIVYPKSLISLAIAILLLVFGVSVIFSQAKSLSLFGNLFQSDSLVSFLIYGLAFFLAAVFVREEKELKWLKLGFFISLFLTTLFGLLSIFGKFIFPWNFSRQIGFNTVGSLLSFAIFIAFGLVIILGEIGLKKEEEKTEKKKLIALLGLGLLVVLGLILLNYSFIWLALALIALIFAGYKFVISPKINSLLIILVSFFLFFGIFSSLLPPLVSLPAEVRPNLSATWTVVKAAPFKNWLIGTGPATFSHNWALYRPIELNQTNLWPLRFNQGFSFLTTLPSTVGILGLLAAAFLLFVFVKGVVQRREIRAIELGIMFLLLGWLLTPNFFTQSLFIFIGLGLAAGLAGSVHPVREKLSNGVQELSLANLSGRKILVLFIILVIFINLSFVSFFAIGKKYLAAIYYEQGLRVYNQTGDFKTALTKIDKASRLDSSDEYLRTLSQFLILRADRLITEGEPGLAPELSRLEIQNTIALAINVAKQATLTDKNESLNWGNLANVYEKIIRVASGADSFAEENYKKVIELDPKNPQAPVDLARTLIASADQSQARNETNVWGQKLNEAKNALEKSIGLKSDYAPAHFLFAQIYIREGNLTKAIDKVDEMKRANPGDAGLAFQLGILYYQRNQMNQSQAEFERAAALDENYSNARYFLGLIYDQKGQKEKAIEQFEKIEKLNPDNQEVKRIIENLRAGRAALQEIVPPAQPPAERTEAPVSETKKQEKP